MKIALLCSGLGNVLRGHEIFAKTLGELLKDGIDLTIYKGGGASSGIERVIENIPRDHPALHHIHVIASDKWKSAARESERLRVEGETFAINALLPLLEGNFDIIHCLEQEVCETLYARRHLFDKTPVFLWSNGGAIPAADQPPCDFVQEHTRYNLRRSQQDKAFYIPHGVDTRLFNPLIESDFRQRNGIPTDAFVVISVGSICYWHKRMDYVIREVAAVPDAWLIIAGQPTDDTPAIRKLGSRLMGDRIVFATLAHEELPQAYAAADVFTLGSLFETFGIVYIEAMAMGLPVICTKHRNQQEIVQKGIFIEMDKTGELTATLRKTPVSAWKELGKQGLEIVAQEYDLERIRQQYIEKYAELSRFNPTLPQITVMYRLGSQIRNLWRISRNKIINFWNR